MLKTVKNNFFNSLSEFKSLLSDSVYLQLNSEAPIRTLDAVKEFFSKIDSSIGQLEFHVNERYVDSVEIKVFSWVIHGVHQGVIKGYLPTGKSLKIKGIAIVESSDEGIDKISIEYDSNTLVEQIQADSQSGFKPNDVFNDLSGPSERIYKLLLSTRNTFSDSKNNLIASLRRESQRAPDMSFLNHKEIQSLRNKVHLIKQTHVLSDGHVMDLFIYKTINTKDATESPTILYFHGGGWSTGSPEGYDIPSRKLALATNKQVICPRYRLAPEHPYPIGFNDCFQIYQNLREKLSDKLIVAGDSSGGTFAAALPLRAYNENVPLPDGVLLLSPATDMRLEDYDSYNIFTKNNIMIDQGLIGLIRGSYVQGDQWDEPYISPMRGNLSCFPQTLMLIGEEDPLFDENQAFAQKVSEQSLWPCKTIIGKGMPHHYHTFVGLSSEVDIAYQSIAGFINEI